MAGHASNGSALLAITCGDVGSVVFVRARITCPHSGLFHCPLLPCPAFSHALTSSRTVSSTDNISPDGEATVSLHLNVSSAADDERLSRFLRSPPQSREQAHRLEVDWLLHDVRSETTRIQHDTL